MCPKYNLEYLAMEEVIKPVKDDEMVWVIDAYAGTSKCMRKCRRPVQTHQR